MRSLRVAIAVLAALVVALAVSGVTAQAATTREEDLERAQGLVAQAESIEQMLDSGQISQLQSQGLGTREAALGRASELRRQAVQIFRAHGDDESASIQLSALAATSRALGLYDLALQDLREAALLDLAMDRADWVILDLQDLAALFAERGQRLEQQLALREVARLAERRGQRLEAAEAMAAVAGLLADLGNWRAAAEAADHAVDLSRPLERPDLLARHLLLLGRAQRHLERFDAARLTLEEARDTAPEDATRADALGELARLATDQGDHTGALALWREAVRLEEQTGEITRARAAWAALVEACLAAGEPGEAVTVSQRRLDDARRRLAQSNDPVWRNLVAADLAAHGRVLLSAGDAAAARAALTEALTAHTQLNSREMQARDRLDLAETALALGDADSALQDLLPVTPVLFRDVEVERRAALLRARALQRLGRLPEADQQLVLALQACDRAGNVDGRIEVLRAAADLWREGRNESRRGAALSQLAAALAEAGREEEARLAYEELMGVYETTQQLREWSQDLTAYAQLCERLGSLDQAIALVERAIEIDTQRQDLAWQAIDHGDLARLRAAAGDLEGAIAAARRIIEIGQRAGSVEQQITGLERLSRCQAQAGLAAEAQAALVSAEALAVGAGDLRARSRVLSSMATLAAAASDWATVETRALAALEVDRQLGEVRHQALDHLNLAVALGHQGRTEEALAHCGEVLKLIPNRFDPLAQAALVNRGHLRLSTDQGEQGVADLQSVLPQLRDGEMWGLAATLLDRVAAFQESRGETDLAIQSLREAIDLAEREIVEQPFDPVIYLPVRVPRSDLYDRIIALLNAQNRAVEALEFVSRQDGIELNSQNLLLAAAGNPALSRTLSAEVAAASPVETTRSVTNPPPEPPTPAAPVVPPVPASEEPPLAQGEWASVLASMSAGEQAAFELTPLNIPFVLRHLPDDQTLFVLYHLGATCHAYVGSLDLPMQGVELAASRDTVLEQVGEFRRLVRDANAALEDTVRGEMTHEQYRAFAGRLEDQAIEILASLYRELVQPLESAVPDYGRYRTILLYPSGALRLLPFGALVRTRPDGRRAHWVESHDIVYFPAGASEIAQEHMEAPVRRVRGDLLLVAWPGSEAERNYIPNVLREEEAIRQIWTAARSPERYHALREGEATRENLLGQLRALEDLQVLHLATHGNLIPGNPEESHIALADRGRLRINDLWSLPLAKTRLTVLSMCDAEYNPGAPADALGTFARAIYVAGCPSVVASLWRVRDESAQRLMEEFYRNLLTEGMSRIGALSAAQRALIATRGQDPDFSHPFDWAPFVLIGEWR